MALVDAQFSALGRDVVGWPDPHPDRDPSADEYSRILDPGKWRIVVARAEVWVAVLSQLGVAQASPLEPTAIVWAAAPGPGVTSALHVRPVAPGATSLIVGRSRLGDIDDAGLVIGAGRPALVLDWFPECGCDACDSGSQDEIDRVDGLLRAFVTGGYRRLIRGGMTITQQLDDRLGWGSSGIGVPHLTRDEVMAALADPTGWHEVTSAAWF